MDVNPLPQAVNAPLTRAALFLVATMNPGQLPHVDFRFDSMADLVKAHQEQLSKG